MGVRLVPIPVSHSSGMAEIVKLLCCAYSVLSKVPVSPAPLYLSLNRDYISSDQRRARTKSSTITQSNPPPRLIRSTFKFPSQYSTALSAQPYSAPPPRSD